jgi:arabinosaccharide transport system permease protein
MFFRYAFGEQSTALFNQLSSLTGASGTFKWLQGKHTGMFALVILCVWRWMGVNILYFLAGLQGISDQLYEAAEIDGAGIIQKFRHITIPSLRPVIIYVITISVYGGFSMFAETFAYWTSRSPGDIGLTLVSYIYSSGFNNNEFGFASAIGVTLLLVILIVNVIQLTFFGFFRVEKD